MDRLNGRIIPKVFTGVSVGAATVYVPLRPRVNGTEWDILFAWGSQNDGAVLCSWGFVSPEAPGGVILTSLTASGANINWDIFAYAEKTPSAARLPLFATWDRYPQFAFVASAAGKIGTVAALVIERIGIEDLE